MMIPPSALDIVFNHAVMEAENPLITEVMRVFSFFGSTPFILLAGIVAIVIACKKKKFHQAILLLIAGILGFVLKEIVKELVQRPRPENNLIALDTFSLPSGHATLSLIFFLWLYQAVLFPSSSEKQRKMVLTGILLIIVAVGVSRIYLRTHWLSDVLAGWMLGGIVLFLSNKAVERWINPTR